MQLTSPSRRALGIVAAGSIGMSSALLGIPGVASATTGTHLTANNTVTVPAGKCGALITLTGASGGAVGGHAGGLGEYYTFDLYTGPGASLAFSIGQTASGATGGTGGAGSNGGNGGTGAAGGGGGTSVSVNGTPVVIIAGGGGAGAGAAGGDTDNPGETYEGTTYSYYGGDPGTNVPGAGGTTEDTSGAAGSDGVGKVGGAGAAGAGGGGGGMLGGGGGASDGTSGAGGGGGSSSYGDTYAGGDKVLTEDGGTATGPGAGSADYDWIDCVVPTAPSVTDYDIGETTATFWLAAGQQADGDTSDMTYEYKLGNGSWLPFSTTVDDGQDKGTITGLTTGTEYDVSFRNVSDYGNGDASDPTTITPYHEASPPLDVTATAKSSSVLVTWDAPADAPDLEGYYVRAMPGVDSDGTGEYYECPAMPLDATDHSCLIGVRAGERYKVEVWAYNQGPGQPAFATTTDVVKAATVPASVPKADAPLKTDKGTITTAPAGSKVTLTGSGYLPYSTVTLLIYSTPTVLGTTQADENGNISATVTVPAGFGGSHSLVASGVDLNGQPRNLRMDITVERPANELAYTGASIVGPTIVCLAALLLGTGLIVVSRRRSAA